MHLLTFIFLSVFPPSQTLQSISIMAYHYEYMKVQGPHLVAVPKSTLSNWMNELNRWCPSLRVIRFHGNKEERQELVDEYFTNEAAAHDGKRPTKQVLNEETGEMEDDNSDNPRAWDVCVTTYEVCNTEKKALSRFAWKYLVIDEGEKTKFMEKFVKWSLLTKLFFLPFCSPSFEE